MKSNLRGGGPGTAPFFAFLSFFAFFPPGGGAPGGGGPGGAPGAVFHKVLG